MDTMTYKPWRRTLVPFFGKKTLLAVKAVRMEREYFVTEHPRLPDPEEVIADHQVAVAAMWSDD